MYGGQPESPCLHCIYSEEASRALGVVAAATDGSDILDMPAEFSDAVDVPDDVPHHVIEEITRRTPGFTGWQQRSWLYHCGDLHAIASSTPRRVSRAEITALLTALGDITTALCDADPVEKAEVYRQLGLRLNYHPETETVRAEVDLSTHRGRTLVSEGRYEPMPHRRCRSARR
nr:CbrC family protein [Micromonospora sediminicola]